MTRRDTQELGMKEGKADAKNKQQVQRPSDRSTPGVPEVRGRDTGWLLKRCLIKENRTSDTMTTTLLWIYYVPGTAYPSQSSQANYRDSHCIDRKLVQKLNNLMEHTRIQTDLPAVGAPVCNKSPQGTFHIENIKQAFPFSRNIRGQESEGEG